MLDGKETQGGGIIFEENFSLVGQSPISAELVFIVDLNENI